MISDPTELVVSGVNIYNNTAIDLRVYLYVQHVSASGHFGSVDWNPAYGYKAGFYAKNQHQTAPYFTVPVFRLDRGFISNIQSLSFISSSFFEFRINSPAAPSRLYIRMIRTDKFDQTVDFTTNYEEDNKLIQPFQPNGTKLIGPFNGPTFVAGTTYKWDCVIDQTTLVNGAKYRFIAIVYYFNGAIHECNSFISQEYNTDADVPYTGGGLTFVANLQDVVANRTNNITACIEERMSSKIDITFPADQWKNDILARLGITTTNDPRRYLTKIEFTIYTTYTDSWGVWVFVYDYRAALKTGATSYTSKSGITITPVSATEMTFRAEWRNRWQLNDTPISVTLNGVPQPVTGSNQYWGGVPIIINWRYVFYYDDYITPFTDVLQVDQYMLVRDYVPDTVLKIEAQNPPFDTKEFWCPGEEMCLQAVIVDPITIDPGLGYNLITNINLAAPNDAYNSLEEAENWVPTNAEFPQSTTPTIYNQETLYGATVIDSALFCVNEELLTIDQEYTITVIAKKN